MSESIRENAPSPRLPDCCNLGVWLRILLAANGGALLVAFARTDGSGLLREFTELAALVEPVALGSLLALCAARRLLERLSYAAGATAAAALVTLVAAVFHGLFGGLLGTALWRELLWALLGAALLLAYFRMQSLARSPAVTEARLLALTARIRPHFLFNTLNAVLGVLRSDPRRAETALEELADLFRALMRDNRELVPLSEEIALARQYLELERLRLGERLRVRWDIESCPADALVPPLLLQPLLENAVYHGIEPAPAPGELLVRLAGDRQRVLIELANPVAAGAANAGEHHAGNRMALANIRERLLLFFDLEARLETQERDGQYLVRIELPYRRRTA